MAPRDSREPGRSASTLELFFDVVFAAAGALSAGIEVRHNDLQLDQSACRVRW